MFVSSFRSARQPASSILHADLDSFYASVEQRDNPALRGRPVAVGGGVILAASYEAKACGVRTAMGGAQARRLCPDLVFVPPHFSSYSRASKDVFAIFTDTTPLVEPLSIDEAFLDVGGLRRIAGTPVEIAERLRDRVRSDVGLNITVGVARTKFLAKVASGVAKPDGLLVVDPAAESAFLHPLPVERLWGVGGVTAAKLHGMGISTVGEVASMSVQALTGLLGAGAGSHLHALALGRDPRPIDTGRRRRSIGSQCALGRRRLSMAEIDAVIVGVVDRVTRRMRTAHRKGRTVVLRFRFADFSRCTRSLTLTTATASTTEILAAARRVFRPMSTVIADRGLTLIGIAVSGFDSPTGNQLPLPFPDVERGRVDTAIDEIRQRFGNPAVTRAVLLGRDVGTPVPMLPD